MEDTIIRIGDMSCQGCVGNVSGILDGVAGVVEAEVSLDEGEARVRFDPQQTSRPALVAAVRNAGFDAE